MAEHWRNTACIQLFIAESNNQALEIKMELVEERAVVLNWNRKGILVICS